MLAFFPLEFVKQLIFPAILYPSIGRTARLKIFTIPLFFFRLSATVRYEFSITVF
jgi:hypothetical protein